MPLPAALANRLAKRGLIQPKGKSGAAALSGHPPGYVEEVIAENYDDPVDSPPAAGASKGTIPTPVKSTQPLGAISNFHRLGHVGCPNKCSIYHVCSKYCVTKYGRGRPNPEPRYNARRLKMLRKYQIPKGWAEIYDAGCGRYYYWKPDTDDVCWRSPRHPKAVVSRSAAELRMEINLKEKEASAMPPPPAPSSRGRDDRKSTADPRSRDRKRRHRDDDLDPMDPAAYSDIPRGDWSSGLEKNNEAKTGVDTTASGPLFQMRPYPSPGAIMRANAESKPK